MNFKSPSILGIKPNNLSEGSILTRDAVNSEFIYYGAYRFNNSYLNPNNHDANYGSYGSTERAEYNENRVNPVLMKPSNYKVAVSSFSLPASIIPMFAVNNNSLLPNNPGRYTVSLSLLNPTPGPNSVIVSDYLFRTIPDGSLIYTYDYVIQEINSVLSSLFAALVAEYDIVNTPNVYTAQTEFPQSPTFLNYEPTSDLFTFYAPYPQMNATPINVGDQKIIITFSNNLYQLFRGINFFINYNGPNSINPSFYRSLNFVTQPENMNVVTLNGNQYIKNTQQFSSAATWFTFNKLLLTSRQLGFRAGSVGTDKSISLVNGLDVTSNVLANFDIQIDNTPENNPNTRIQYSPNYLHWKDIFKDSPLYNIDLQFVLADNEGKSIDLPLESGNDFSVNLVFARKIF